MFNYKLTLVYDGTRYSGWQTNKNAPDTIQGKLNETLSKYFGEATDLIGAGRTDKGVHARAMTANFHLSKEIDQKSSLKELNHYLPADIAIKDIEQVDERFHSRFHSKSKEYRYICKKGYNGIKPIFDRDFCLVLEEPLNIGKMIKASRFMTGEHDFRGFSSDRTKKSTVRCIDSIQIEDNEDSVIFIFTGNGFLYHMVRILVGTLIEIGSGKRKEESITKILSSKKREEAGYLVPAKGLILHQVNY